MNIFKVVFVEIAILSNTLSKISISLRGAYLLIFKAFLCMIPTFKNRRNKKKAI